MPESVTGTNSRMIGGTQVERPLEDLPSLCRAKAAPTMRVIIGEPPAKDMGCNPAAAGCGDSRERLALAAWRQAVQASALAGVIRRAPAGQTVRRCHPGVSALPCISPMTPGTTTGPTGVSVGASPEVLPSTRRKQRPLRSTGERDSRAGPCGQRNKFPLGRPPCTRSAPALFWR